MTALSPPTLLQIPYQKVCGSDIINLHSQSLEDFYPVRVVKRPSFSTFILKSSLVYVEGGLHAEFEVWEYSDTAYATENAHRVKHQTLWKGGQQWKYF